MKNMIFLKLCSCVAAFAFLLSVTSARGLSGFYFSQPKVPKKVMALRKRASDQ